MAVSSAKEIEDGLKKILFQNQQSAPGLQNANDQYHSASEAYSAAMPVSANKQKKRQRKKPKGQGSKDKPEQDVSSQGNNARNDNLPGMKLLKHSYLPDADNRGASLLMETIEGLKSSTNNPNVSNQHRGIGLDKASEKEQYRSKKKKAKSAGNEQDVSAKPANSERAKSVDSAVSQTRAGAAANLRPQAKGGSVERQSQEGKPAAHDARKNIKGKQDKFSKADEPIPEATKKLLEENCVFPLRKKSLRFPTAKYFCRLCEYHCDSVTVCVKHCRDTRHQRLKQIKATNYLLRSLPAPTAAHVQALDILIMSVYKDQAAGPDNLQARLAEVGKFKEYIKDILQGRTVTCYGSTISGFALNSSDVNLDINGQAKTLVDVFDFLRADQSGYYTDVQSNFSAKVPCVLFRAGEGKLKCQLTINNNSASDTSQLLALYTAMDNRVKQLGVALRYWAKVCRVDNQETGTLAAYVFGLMTVYFLQQVQPPVLPVLHQYLPKEKISQLNCLKDLQLIAENLDKYWKCENRDSVGQLWLKMFKFYSHELDTGAVVLSLRQHRKLSKSSKGWGSKRLAVEDPMAPKRNIARSVSHSHVYEYIYDCLRSAYLYFGIPQTKNGPLYSDSTLKKYESLLQKDMKALDNASQGMDENVKEGSGTEKDAAGPPKGEGENGKDSCTDKGAARASEGQGDTGAKSIVGESEGKGENIKEVDPCYTRDQKGDEASDKNDEECKDGNASPKEVDSVSEGKVDNIENIGCVEKCMKTLFLKEDKNNKNSESASVGESVDNTSVVKCDNNSDGTDKETDGCGADATQVFEATYADLITENPSQKSENKISKVQSEKNYHKNELEPNVLCHVDSEHLNSNNAAITESLQSEAQGADHGVLAAETLTTNPDMLASQITRSSEILSDADAIEKLVHGIVTNAMKALNLNSTPSKGERCRSPNSATDHVDSAVAKHCSDFGCQGVPSSVDIAVSETAVKQSLDSDNRGSPSSGDTPSRSSHTVTSIVSDSRPLRQSDSVQDCANDSVLVQDCANDSVLTTDSVFTYSPATSQDDSNMAEETSAEENKAGAGNQSSDDSRDEEDEMLITETAESANKRSPECESGDEVDKEACSSPSPERTKEVLESFGLVKKDAVTIETSISLLDEETSLRLADMAVEDFVFKFAEEVLTDGKGPAVMCSICQKEGHLKRNCPEEVLPPLEPLPPLRKPYKDVLDQILYHVPGDFEPGDREKYIRQEVLKELEDFIRETYPDVRLQLFGSSHNGFGFQHSDLDICMTFDSYETGEELDAVEIIENLAKKLKKHKGLYNVIAISSAKVPIVKFMHRRSHLEGDISLYNTLALQNTRMLRMYCELDYRVKVLGYAMKVFAKVCDIGDASRGSLSSYAYILMVLYFLQQRKPPVIPVLQELHVNDEAKPELIIDGWNAWFFDNIHQIPKAWPEFGKNKESVAELWVGLLRFYTENFNHKDLVISIRQLRPMTRFERLWNGNCFAIEDPFDLSHNLGGGLSRKMHTFIMKAFRNGRRVFGTSVDGIPPGYPSLQDYLFDPGMLIEGDPPNDRGCRVCGKIGHFAKECPVIINRKERKERERERKAESKERESEDSSISPTRKPRNISEDLWRGLLVEELDGSTEQPSLSRRQNYQRSKSEGHPVIPQPLIPQMYFVPKQNQNQEFSQGKPQQAQGKPQQAQGKPQPQGKQQQAQGKHQGRHQGKQQSQGKQNKAGSDTGSVVAAQPPAPPMHAAVPPIMLVPCVVPYQPVAIVTPQLRAAHMRQQQNKQQQGGYQQYNRNQGGQGQDSRREHYANQQQEQQSQVRPLISIGRGMTARNMQHQVGYAQDNQHIPPLMGYGHDQHHRPQLNSAPELASSRQASSGEHNQRIIRRNYSHNSQNREVTIGNEYYHPNHHNYQGAPGHYQQQAQHSTAESEPRYRGRQQAGSGRLPFSTNQPRFSPRENPAHTRTSGRTGPPHSQR